MAKKVLVVEDSETTRSLIISTVEEIEGLKVIGVKNGFEALKALPRHAVDLIITDINMPDINGLEIVNFVKTHPDYRSIPLVIVSTEQSEEDIQKGLALGASAYVPKPFQPSQLKEKVEKLLQKDGQKNRG